MMLEVTVTQPHALSRVVTSAQPELQLKGWALALFTLALPGLQGWGQRWLM